MNVNMMKAILSEFKETIDKFIKWICKKFDMGTENNLIRDFEKETRTCLDGEEQIKRDERKRFRVIEIGYKMLDNNKKMKNIEILVKIW